MSNSCPTIDIKIKIPSPKAKSPKAKSPKANTLKENPKTPEGKIYNPETGRFVSITGKIGKELLKNQGKVIKEKSPSPKKIQVVIKPNVKKDIFSIMNETGDIIKGQISNYDKLKLNMLGLKHITFSDEKYNPFLTKFNEPTKWGQISMNDDEFIHGHYKKKIHFFIQKHQDHFDLIIQEGDTHLLIKDVKKALKSEAAYPCDIFHLKGKTEINDKIIDNCNEFLQYVFGTNPKTFKVKLHEFIYPSTYEEDKSPKSYNIAKPPPTVAIKDSEDGQYDPCFVSKINNEVVYVFHVHKPEYPTMKGYIPIGVTVVLRELKNVNYKYTNIIRLSYPSWGVYFNNNADDLSLYMRELRNIIISIGFLSKFRGFSPYPRVITGCKVSPRRIQLRTCEK